MSDPYRFTTLAHASHSFCNPVGEATLDRFVESLALPPGARVLDAGCGKGELLTRVAARWQARGVGVDVNPAFLAEARRRAGARGVTPEWIEAPVDEAGLAAASFDALLCVGSAHVFAERLADSLAAMCALVKPGGAILLGHGHWMREPAAEYLASFGGSRDELGTHEENLATIAGAGLMVETFAATTLAEWDAYEGAYSENVERWFAAHPEDPDRDAFLARSRAWKAAYDRRGRGTMGFGLFRLRRADQSAAGSRRIR